MKCKYTVFLVILLLTFCISACSNAGKSPVSTGSPDDQDVLPSYDHGPGGMALGAYMVHLDASTQDVEIVPVRTPSAIGDAFLLGISQGGPAGRWFDVSGVQFLSHDDVSMKDILSLKMKFEHPFPLSARPDLAGWDLKAIFVYDSPIQWDFNEFNVLMNPPLLVNSYGLTGEWDDESDLVFPTDADIHEFVILSEDDRAVTPFNFQDPQGWNVFHPGMIAENSFDIQIDSGASLDFMIFLTMGYEVSATFANTIHNPGEPGSRENPVYNPPEGNSHAAWKIEVEETGVGMIDDAGSETTYQARVWDWQHAKQFCNSKIKKISIHIPGVMSSAVETSTFTGTGRENDPVTADITVANDLDAPDGDYYGIVKVKDGLTGVPGEIMGIKTDWKTQFYFSDFDSYQYFNHHITHYDPINTDLFDVALAQFSRTRDDMYWDSGTTSLWKATDTVYMFNLWTTSKMPDFDDYHRNPLNLPVYVDSFTAQVKNAAENSEYDEVLESVAQRLGYPLDPLQYSWTSSASPLVDAIDDFHQAVGDPLSPSERTTIETDAADIPLSVQEIAAKCLNAAMYAWQHNEAAWTPFTTQQRTDAWTTLSIHAQVIANLNYGLFVMGGAEVATAFADIKPDLESFSDAGVYNFEWTTPVGKVVIGGNGNDSYSGGNYLLLLDVGGSDTYIGNIAGNSSATNSVSIAIDFSGNDNYGNNSEQFSQGGARVGIAALWDFSGSDTYNGDLVNQGAAMWGCGLLIDTSGDDHYNGDQYAQAAGNWGGSGFLIDEAGSDTYYSFQCSQGFCYVRSSGTLIDIAGDDDYIADDVDIRYPSAQTAEHNASLSQACAFGWRSDPSFLAGGIATLLDFGGADEYSCGVFGQCSSFMFATSILKDYGPEDDEFYGIWYVQSGNAHMGVSYMYNEGGNDSYECTMNVSQGGAHDFSHAWFLDISGDDTYIAPGISIGGGNEVGIGVFIDYDGSDSYTCTNDNSMGGGTYSTGRNRDSYGIFVDDGGDTDTYTHTNCANDTEWSNGGTGGGVDGMST